MKKFAVVTNFNIYEKATAALKVCDKLNALGCEIFVASFNRDRIARNGKGVNRDYLNYIPIEKLYSVAELIIVLGGDGTILEAARRAIPLKKPIFGINLGRLGYMAELEINEIDRIEDIINEKYFIEERMLLSVELLNKEGKQKFFSFALNDAVISNGSFARIIDLSLSENGEEVSTYRADGIIVATPTGSTAYSMSAGGAIVDPRVNCICVTPVCPHSLASRAMIFPDCSVIEVKNICEREKMLYVTLDGKSNQELLYGEKVCITKSNLAARFVRLNHKGFYKKLRNKMST